MKLNLQERTIKGKKVKQLRLENLIPGVCYGRDFDSVIFSIAKKDIEKALASDEVVFNVDGAVDNKSVLIKKVSYHPVTETVEHIDLLLIHKKEKVENAVELHMVGESPAVKTLDGVLVQSHNEIIVSALPSDLFGSIDIDISNLTKIGSHLSAGEIKLPKNVDLVTDPSEILISIVHQVEEKESEVEELDMDSIEISGKEGKEQKPEGEDEQPEV